MSQYFIRRVSGLVQSNNVHHKNTNLLNNLSSNRKFCFEIRHLYFAEFWTYLGSAVNSTEKKSCIRSFGINAGPKKHEGLFSFSQSLLTKALLY